MLRSPLHHTLIAPVLWYTTLSTFRRYGDGGNIAIREVQVARLLIFGPGRVGANIAAYARHLGVDVDVVSRAQAAGDPDQMAPRIQAATTVAAAVPDSAIAGVFDRWRGALRGKRCIHFSGALTLAGADSYHPLYSFPRSVLPNDVMRRVAFAIAEGAPALSDLLPGAPNPVFTISEKDRAFYHAIAVLTGNFSAHIWNQAARAMAQRLPDAPPEILGPYLAGVVDRFQESPFDSVTGPVARRDQGSIAANIQSLAEHPQLQTLYEAFLASAWPDRPRPEAEDG